MVFKSNCLSFRDLIEASLPQCVQTQSGLLYNNYAAFRLSSGLICSLDSNFIRALDYKI
jgi:hypothetical protein